VLPSRVPATPVVQPAATSTPAPLPSPSPPTSAAAPVTVTLRAWDGAFNRDAISVAAGSIVTLVLQNDDPGIYHNIGVTMAGTDLTEACAGPCSRRLTFIARPGTYQFFCNIHVGMVGNLTVY
jgi:plastocyanin